MSATERKARQEIENEKKMQAETQIINQLQAPEEVNINYNL